jgi:hypothetical protein
LAVATAAESDGPAAERGGCARGGATVDITSHDNQGAGPEHFL